MFVLYHTNLEWDFSADSVKTAMIATVYEYVITYQLGYLRKDNILTTVFRLFIVSY